MRNNAKLITSNILILSLICITIIETSCGASSNRSAGEILPNVTPTSGAVPTLPGGGTVTPSPTPDNYALTVDTPTVTSILTAESFENTCSDISFTVYSNGVVKAGATISASFKNLDNGLITPIPSGTPGASTTPDTSSAYVYGNINPSSTTSDTNGKATFKYCSGTAEGKVIIIGKVGSATINSAEINITRKPTFGLEFKPADSTKPDAVINLNYFDSGDDCKNIEFKLLRNGSGYGGQTVRFKTQEDFPPGVKLANKTTDGLTDTNPATGKKFAYYDAKSNSGGVLSVPICAGFLPGNVILNGTFISVTENNKEYPARSSVISISGGIANWQNISVTFDQKNARTIKAAFNTNSEVNIPFKVRLGSRWDGVLALMNPLGVLSEVGKLLIDKNGLPDENGVAKFTFEELNLGASRPIKTSSAATPYSSLASPLDFPNDTTFTEISKDWRTTVMYYVKGQEQFFDYYNNGRYAAGCMGFWDKNQNGLFDDGVDSITTGLTYYYLDPKSAGAFDANNVDHKVVTKDVTGAKTVTFASGIEAWNNLKSKCDWFIDLPSPFVDSNENGAWDAGESIIGEKYSDPNAVWDNSTYIWKSFYIPIYVGTSPYAMTHSLLNKNLSSNNVATSVTNYISAHPFNAEIKANIPGTFIQQGALVKSFYNGVAANDPSIANEATAWRYLFAQGITGAPIPGDTSITITFNDISGGVWGKRDFFANFYMQPDDDILEPWRRLINGDGSATAKMNFNIPDHLASAASYPIQFRLGVTQCDNYCSGDVKIDGLSCDARTVRMNLTADTDTVSGSLYVPSVKLCTCATGATFSKGACTCPKGQVVDSAGACNPPPP